ncbi:MAG: hypothetical protein KDA84_30680 [Planctomycetaceae bacterium]|nr:hypothetical protein [Planctomycetaceae bacterium]
MRGWLFTIGVMIGLVCQLGKIGWAQSGRYPIPPARTVSPVMAISPYVGHTPPKIQQTQAESPVAPAPVQSGDSVLGGTGTNSGSGPANAANSSSLNTATPQSLVSETRQLGGTSSLSDTVPGNSAGFRATTDAGNLLGKSTDSLGASSQNRTPIVTDNKVRG